MVEIFISSNETFFEIEKLWEKYLANIYLF